MALRLLITGILTDLTLHLETGGEFLPKRQQTFMELEDVTTQNIVLFITAIFTGLILYLLNGVELFPKRR
jgi:hypothetical protein